MERARALSGCDAVLCLMSGNFTQRGDICVLSKRQRARHAVLGGADAVLELPIPFAVAPAEIFARGAVKLLSSIPEVGCIAFGCENADADFIKAAEILLNESETFKHVLKQRLESGDSYVRSRAEAFAACGGDRELLCRPNNILGVEYARSVLLAGGKIELMPVSRRGADFGEGALTGEFSSAKAIRNNIGNTALKDCMPAFSYEDLKDFSAENALFWDILRYELLKSPPERLVRIFGCGEGLENRLPALAALPYDEFISAACGKRYTASRVKRIALSNMLGLFADDCRRYLGGKLYLKPIAVNSGRADPVLGSLSRSCFPLLLKERDENMLSEEGKKCLKKDKYALKMRNFIFGEEDTRDYPAFIQTE